MVSCIFARTHKIWKLINEIYIGYVVWVEGAKAEVWYASPPPIKSGNELNPLCDFKRKFAKMARLRFICCVANLYFKNSRLRDGGKAICPSNLGYLLIEKRKILPKYIDNTHYG